MCPVDAKGRYPFKAPGSSPWGGARASGPKAGGGCLAHRSKSSRNRLMTTGSSIQAMTPRSHESTGRRSGPVSASSPQTAIGREYPVEAREAHTLPPLAEVSMSS